MDCSRASSDASNCSACVVKLIAATIVKKQNCKLSSKGQNKRALEDSGDGPMAKYRQYWMRKSANRKLKTISNAVATKKNELLLP